MGRTALWWAAVQGDEEVVKLLLEMGKADVNAADSDGATPLWRAAHDGHGTVCDTLLPETRHVMNATSALSCRSERVPSAMSHELQSDVIGDNLLEMASTSFVRLSIRYLRNLSLPLLFTLQSHTASGFLFTNTSHGTLRSVFLRLISAAASDNFDFDHVKPLLKSALAIEPDTLTGIEPMTLSPNPPRLPDR
ncbi:hypothetical protein FOPG_20031 [Fusarium oxysporum f. sp. conglutinans race 2 54008]|nr:hypothetical protein FOPG_20031 [Fusarium oxysporum f. sp. conglutinans race 2 54008]